ncbi:hypothetical protein ACFLS1_10275 [Verrucomicrobiota bacterium]
MTERKIWVRLSVSVLACALLALPCAWATGNIDSTNKTAWTENTGWANAEPTNGGITVHFDGISGYLTGHIWGENVGWIKMGNDSGGPYTNSSASDWGVNLNSTGNLTGYAWGENIGWINFTSAYSAVTIDMATGRFDGYAWGENIGWLKFKGSTPDYNVRTLAFDTQAQGTPNWWLDHHSVTEGYNAGDGVAAWKKYVMDTDPNIEGDYLRITALSNSPAGTQVSFMPASTRRYYTLMRREDLTTGGWSNVVGEVNIQYGTGGAKTMQDTNTATLMFYRVQVSVSP